MAEYRQRCSCGCTKSGCPCRHCGGTGYIAGNGSAGQSRGQIRPASSWDGNRLTKILRTGGAARE